MSHSCPNLVSTSFLYNPYIPFLICRNFLFTIIQGTTRPLHSAMDTVQLPVVTRILLPVYIVTRILLPEVTRILWGAVCVKIVLNWGIYKSPFLFINLPTVL